MWAGLLAFVGVSALVICAPGPDTALTVRNALIGGRRGGVCTAAGVALGQLVWAVAAGLGVAGLIRASQPAFHAVQAAGAVYLVFLGLQSVRSALRDHGDAGVPGRVDTSRISPWTATRQGLVSNLANPKMAVFFVSLLPQFVPAHAAPPAPFLALGLIFALMTLGWLAGYAAVVDRAGQVLRRRRVRRAVQAGTGAVLIAFGLRLATDQP